MRAVRVILAYLIAAVVTVVAASALHTQFVLAGLTGLGVDIPTGVRLRATGQDILGLAPQYGTVIAAVLAVALLIAAGLKRVLRSLAPIAYPLAGAAAIAAILTGMAWSFDMTPIASARTPLGFAAQCLAGALGGLTFALLPRRRQKS